MFFIYTVYIFLFVLDSVFGIGESTVVLGGESTWKTAEYRNGITEVSSVRPHPVLALSSAAGKTVSGYTAASGVMGNFIPLTEHALDLSILFDESNTGFYKDKTGNYLVSVSPEVEAVDHRYARTGAGAALFNGTGSVTVEPQSRNALFASGSRIRDFTIEFWLFPLNMENGEQIFSWVGTRLINGNYVIQRIRCTFNKNRLQWSFENFFTSADGVSFVNTEFSGNTPVVPKAWSHHLVRFDATTGMLEYLSNETSEAIVYSTVAGREKGDVYTPVAGNNGVIRIGERFMGIIDEFKIHSVCAGRSPVQKYIPSGGRAETRAIDLGTNNSGVIRIDAAGGRVSVKGSASGGFNSEFRENGRFRFSDMSEMNFFIRSNQNPYLLNTSPWISFTPGTNISGISGRYVQIAVDFYPSANGETSPYLSELRIIYKPGEPPLPPGNLTATAVDGGVLLHWKRSPDSNTTGYLIYYSSVRGELFGNDSLLGASPIDAGNKNSLFIDGLKNGTLYYFRVAAYDYISGTINHNVGEFSREVTARPLAGLTLAEMFPQVSDAVPASSMNGF
ncbi:MAG: fibronectin type III domain-containing protein [Treponema sp.]|nr:fibronectin type III domain-containing protein [Treponema sp.]